MYEFFKIINKCDSFCVLNLFIDFQVHEIFNVNLLRKDFNDSLLEQHNSFSEFIIVNDELEWEIKYIVVARTKHR